MVRQGSNDFSVAPYQCVRVSSSMCNIKEMHFYFGVSLELFAAVAEISKCSFYNGKIRTLLLLCVKLTLLNERKERVIYCTQCSECIL